MLAASLASLALAAAPPPSRFVQVDARRKVVDVDLIASYDAENNGFNFDGYSRGRMMVVVPLGWRVRVTCRNDAGLRHSCAVVQGPLSATPAFRGASTPNPIEGLLQNQTARFAFVASRTGVFRFACLVPGHEAARMYDVLEIVRHGKPGAVDLQASR